MSYLEVSSVSKRKGEDFVLNAISFQLEKSQKIAITGETGSGKSTLLKIIAGFIQPDNGAVMLAAQRILGPEEKLVPGHRLVAYLSQQFELRNAYRVEEILEYATMIPLDEAENLFDLCRISHLLKRRTDQLSGGEKQRVAMARLLVSAPDLLLLDEPFSNLDMIHKKILKTVIREIGEKLHLTCIMVSHSPLDTLSWADEIIVMKDGKIIQQGRPEMVYRKPVNEYAAGLFGGYDLIDGTLFGLPNGDGKKLLVRPGDIRVVDDEADAVRGEVVGVAYYGSYYEVELLVNDIRLTVRSGRGDFVAGDLVFLKVDNKLC